MAVITPASADPLPFNDGMYSSSLSICDAIESGMEAWHEYFQSGIVRVINGPQISDAIETQCDLSNVRRVGDRVLFTANCVTWDVWETVEGGYTYISSDAFHFRGQTLSRCDAAQTVAPEDGFTASTEEIIDLWSEANSGCRGGSGDDPRTMGACGAREEYHAILQGRGWCYGRPEDAEYQKAWQRCN
ncbi:hypothetical protein [Devosia epidermidihirudinis]|uniref:hypothetical protein n=1 Tax=Devosia epidermidihirudinis TaxID=1293439 RepID=UPI0012E08A2B|nr:hypothetical protein [Devosia epidermidihirudinis]